MEIGALGNSQLFFLQQTSSGKPDGQEGELTAQEKAEVEALKKRDREVRAHEAAHAAAGGAHAGAPSFQFTVGPDGRLYAVSGEVQIDTSPVAGNPQATIRKMEQIQAAALAPADPSGQDRAVAAAAARQAAQARAELNQQRQQESNPQASRSENPLQAYLDNLSAQEIGQAFDVTA